MKSFFIYTYHHWDQFDGMKAVKTKPEETAAVAEVLKAAGWEGDGTLEKFMVPPIFFKGNYAEAVPVYHVKQSNNGTSFFALPVDLGHFAEDNACLTYEGKFTYGLMAVKA